MRHAALLKIYKNIKAVTFFFGFGVGSFTMSKFHFLWVLEVLEYVAWAKCLLKGPVGKNEEMQKQSGPSVQN